MSKKFIKEDEKHLSSQKALQEQELVATAEIFVDQILEYEEAGMSEELASEVIRQLFKKFPRILKPFFL